jgi:hypothetical protein
MAQITTLTAKAAIRKTRPADFANAYHDAELGGATLIDNGTIAGTCDLAWTDKAVSIAASGQLNLDLNGALIDDLGQTVNFAKVKAIMIKASAANVNDVIMGNAASNGFVGPFGAAAHTIAVKPGGTLLLECSGTLAGWPVTAGTGDILRLANGGAGSAVLFDIAILGTSA